MSPKTRALTAFGVAFVAAAGALALAGCGGGGGGSSSSGSGTSGDVAVSVTDAPVDAIETFDCRVTAITLTRQDGLVVSALPAAQRIDFADDVSVRELVAAATIPRGIYTGLSVTLDLATPTADPDGVVARLVGQSADANVVDLQGNQYTAPVALDVQLDPDRPLVIAAGTPRALDLDFDLNSSVVIDAAANTIRMTPVLSAEVEARRARLTRVRGPLLRVDAARQSFTLALRPRPSVTPFGSIAVTTTASTVFDLSGLTLTGASGFAVFASSGTGTAVVVHGLFDAAQHRLVAKTVETGAAVVGGTFDIVDGLVVAEPTPGSVFEVRGYTIARPGAGGTGGALSHARLVTVTAAPSTKVVARGLGTLAPPAIAVGQRVICAGTLTADAMGSPGTPTAFIRLVETRVCGPVAGAAAGGFTMTVERIGPLPLAAFTGAHANPWTVSTSLSAPSTGADTLVSGILSTATAQVNADVPNGSVADLSGLSTFVALWIPRPSSSPVSAGGGSSITFDLTGATLTAIALGCDVPPYGPAGASMTIVAGSSPLGLFVVREVGGPTVPFLRFDRFHAYLAARLAAGLEPRRVTAVGELGTGAPPLTMDADAVTVILE